MLTEGASVPADVRGAEDFLFLRTASSFCPAARAVCIAHAQNQNVNTTKGNCKTHGHNVSFHNVDKGFAFGSGSGKTACVRASAFPSSST